MATDTQASAALPAANTHQPWREPNRAASMPGISAGKPSDGQKWKVNQPAAATQAASARERRRLPRYRLRPMTANTSKAMLNACSTLATQVQSARSTPSAGGAPSAPPPLGRGVAAGGGG